MNPMAAIFAIGSDRTVPQLPNKFTQEAVDFVEACLTRYLLSKYQVSKL